MPAVKFLSLFVPDLEDAARRYEAILGVAPTAQPRNAPPRHPFSPAKAVVFDLGTVELALYQTDGKTTHAGDVGIGIETGEDAGSVGKRAASAGASVFPGVHTLREDGRKMAVFMTPDRHFFEAVSGSRRD